MKYKKTCATINFAFTFTFILCVDGENYTKSSSWSPFSSPITFSSSSHTVTWQWIEIDLAWKALTVFHRLTLIYDLKVLPNSVNKCTEGGNMCLRNMQIEEFSSVSLSWKWAREREKMRKLKISQVITQSDEQMCDGDQLWKSSAQK